MHTVDFQYSDIAGDYLWLRFHRTKTMEQMDPLQLSHESDPVNFLLLRWSSKCLKSFNVRARNEGAHRMNLHTSVIGLWRAFD